MQSASLDGAFRLMRHNDLAWINLALDSWLLAVEASAVAGLRLAKLNAGGAAGAAEATRMVTEKIKAGMDLQSMAIMGGLGTTLESATAASVLYYRDAVRSNHRRLSRTR